MHRSHQLGRAATHEGALRMASKRIHRLPNEGVSARLVTENLGPEVTGENHRLPVGQKFWAVGTILSRTYGLRPGQNLR